MFSFKFILSKNCKNFYQRSTENLFLCIFVVDASFEALALVVCHVCNVKAGGGHSSKNYGKIVHFIYGKSGEGDEEYGQQVTCNNCIEETPVETSSETFYHLTLDKFLSNKVKENKNDIYTCSYRKNCCH